MKKLAIGLLVLGIILGSVSVVSANGTVKATETQPTFEAYYVPGGGGGGGN